MDKKTVMNENNLAKMFESEIQGCESERQVDREENGVHEI